MAEQVTVGCKLPNGMVLEIEGQQVSVAGFRSAEARIIGGYGLTTVDRAFWDAWLVVHHDQPYVKNGVVFAQEKANSASAQAREQETVTSGLEPLPQENPQLGITRDAEAMAAQGV